MAAGKRRHVWPALERAAGGGEADLEAPERLAQIPADELALLRRFVTTLGELRERGPRLPLAGLVEAVTTATGYDLAVLMRPAGEARYANVRKLMRLAAEFEAREGRDLRGLLDFLAARAESDAEAQAATAAEGHDGVRIMTVHNAKGLEFDVVAVPDLSRSLLAGARPPALVLGRELPPRVGMQLRRLGSGAINLYGYAELLEEARGRDSEEGLRLFHVAATRARKRLILSGVVKPEPGRETKLSTPVVERLVEALGVPRDADSEVEIPAAEPRPGLDASFAPSQLGGAREPALSRARRRAVPDPPRRRRRPAARRGTAAAGRASAADRPQPAPLLHRDRRLRGMPIPLLHGAGAGPGPEPAVGSSPRIPGTIADGPGNEGPAVLSGREERSARGAAVHALLEWSQANEWAEPGEELALRHALASGFDPGATGPATLLAPVRGWLGSELRRQIGAAGARARAEVPILLGIGDAVLRGSIDLLVERDGMPPLVVDYKTDRLGSTDPEAHAARYGTQRSIYALAVAESLDVEEVEVAYVFLERPAEPVVSRLGPAELEAGRERLATAIAKIGAGHFPTATPAQRTWDLCRGCPALRGLCSGPGRAEVG